MDLTPDQWVWIKHPNYWLDNIIPMDKLSDLSPNELMLILGTLVSVILILFVTYISTK